MTQPGCAILRDSRSERGGADGKRGERKFLLAPRVQFLSHLRHVIHRALDAQIEVRNRLLGFRKPQRRDPADLRERLLEEPDRFLSDGRGRRPGLSKYARCWRSDSRRAMSLPQQAPASLESILPASSTRASGSVCKVRFRAAPHGPSRSRAAVVSRRMPLQSPAR